MDDTPAVFEGEPAEHPGFATERLALDPETVLERIHETLGDVSATRTDEGMKFRTPDGTLVAVLGVVEEDGDPTVLLRYRTEHPSEPGTLKARRLWEALESDVA